MLNLSLKLTKCPKKCLVMQFLYTNHICPWKECYYRLMSNHGWYFRGFIWPTTYYNELLLSELSQESHQAKLAQKYCKFDHKISFNTNKNSTITIISVSEVYFDKNVSKNSNRANIFMRLTNFLAMGGVNKYNFDTMGEVNKYKVDTMG